jgi:hypothetical protein
MDRELKEKRDMSYSSLPHMTATCRGITDCEVLQVYLSARSSKVKILLRMRQEVVDRSLTLKSLT